MPSNDAHPRWQRTVHIVAATQVAVLIGFNFAFPFLPLLIQDLGVTDRGELALWTGLAIGLSGMVMAVVSPIWGLVADRFGRKTMLIRSIGAGAILTGLQAAVTNVAQLAVVRILQGALTGTQTAGWMLIAGIAPKERTGYSIGLLNTAIQVGNLAGPVLGGIAVATIGLRSSFLVGAVVLGICTVITIAFVEDVPVAPRTESRGMRGLASDIVTPFSWTSLRGPLVIGSVVQIVGSGTVALTAIYMQDLARPSWLTVELTIGLALALVALTAAIAMPLFGSWADRHDPRALLVAGLAVFGVSLVPQALIPDAVAYLALRTLTGVGIAAVTSAVAVLTRAGAPRGGEGRAFGALAAAQNLGWGVGPLVGSAFAAAAGIPALYLVGAVVAIALVPLSLSRLLFPVAQHGTPAVSEPAPLAITTATAED